MGDLIERMAGTVVLLGGRDDVWRRAGVGLCGRGLRRTVSLVWQHLLNLGYCQRQAP